jgi:hypothetical protein
MKGFAFFCLTVLCSAFITACGSSSSSSTTTTTTSGLNLADKAVKSTPQIFTSLTASISKPQMLESVSKDTTPSSGFLGIVNDFFKAECHNDDNSLNICPSGVTLDTTNKFTTTTLIGMIQHADMKMANIYTIDEVVDPITGESTAVPLYKTCEKGTSHAALTNHTPVYTPTNANTFIVDFGSLPDCVAYFTSGTTNNYTVYSKATDNLNFASIVSRKQEALSSPVSTASDIFQSYLRRDSSNNPQLLGFNLASFDEKSSGNYYGRAILITNIANNKFVVKYSTGPATGGNFKQLFAIGVGGYNPSTSSWVTGYYYIKAKSTEVTEDTACVQNGLTPAVASSTNCTTYTDLVGAWSWSSLLTWLDANSTDQTNLAGFETFFTNTSYLESTTVPQNGTDYFPTSISN